jgi:hypothetical protein
MLWRFGDLSVSLCHIIVQRMIVLNEPSGAASHRIRVGFLRPVGLYGQLYKREAALEKLRGNVPINALVLMISLIIFCCFFPFPERL